MAKDWGAKDGGGVKYYRVKYYRTIIWGMSLLWLTGCALTTAGSQNRQTFALPHPQTNMAVALGDGPQGPTLYGFNGLGSAKDWTSVNHHAFACPIKARLCHQLPDVPVAEGRLASVAVRLGQKIYLFGGYSVAADGSEVSTRDVLMFDPQTGQWLLRAPMPVPVDDAVVLAYQDRYIYLVSGWHDKGNVKRVQLYDAKTNRWSRATDFPGIPVFGHGGGIVGNRFIIADGVAVIGHKNGRRQFGIVSDVWQGIIDEQDPTIIAWRSLPAHPGPALYRPGVMGDAIREQIIFAGGTDNPYNFDGIGYDGVPSHPVGGVFAYDLATEGWVTFDLLPLGVMDHRGLLKHDEDYFLMGGMDDRLQVSDGIVRFTLPPKSGLIE